jgi:hypothetical protein
VCRSTQHLGALEAGRDDGELRAKRLRNRDQHVSTQIIQM